MSLLQLPSETLIQVMDYVGSSYFRQDLERLMVCKQWYLFASAACFKDLRLCQKNLRCLLSSPDARRSLLLVKDNLEILDLELKGFEDWGSIPPPRAYPPDINVLGASVWHGEIGDALLEAWTTVLDDDLNELASIAKESKRLRVIRIKALSEYHPLFPHLPRRDYLSPYTIQNLLSVKNLTTLELDLCGSNLMPLQEHHDDFHVCTSIGAILTSLRRLRVRMRTICADVLRLQHHNTSLRLSEVLINLSLSNESPTTTWAAHSKQCGSTVPGILSLQAAIKDQAEALAARMDSPKLIRILTHSLPQIEMLSLDILTGKRMVLADKMGWEDDGKTIKDVSDSESEILDDDFSTSSDE